MNLISIKSRKLRAFTLVESLVAIVLLAIVTTVFSSTYVAVKQAELSVGHGYEAEAVLSQTVEAVRSIRDQNFLNLSNGQHGLLYQANLWEFDGSSDIVDGEYTRSVTIDDVLRNNSGDIDASGSILDERVKNVNVQVSWQSEVEGAQSISTQYPISDIYAYDGISTTEGEWALGTHQGTMATDAGDGALELEIIQESWLETLRNLEDVFEQSENGNADRVFVKDGIAYMAGERNGSTDPFRILDISDPDNVIKLGSLDVGNHVRDVVVQGNYAYLAVNDGDSELMVVDVSNPAEPAIVNSVNISGNEEGYRVAIDNNILYLGIQGDDKFSSFSLANPSSPVLLDEYDVNEEIRDMDVINGVAYLSIHYSDALVILDVSEPSNIQLFSEISVNDNESHGVAYQDSKLYIGTHETGSDDEFKIYDVSNPSAPSLLGGVEIGQKIEDVAVFGDFAFVTTDDHDYSYVVIDIRNPSNPSVIEIIDLDTRCNGLFADANSVYLTCDDNGTPFYIFTYPENIYNSLGTYDSVAVDTGSDTTVWHSFYWEGILPATTSASFQLRTADTESNLSSATWVGPDGSSGTSYTANDTIIVLDPAASGTRWMQYRVSLVGDGEYTPEIYNVRFQYSP